MPRLPTILVIGSHAISTSSVPCSVVVFAVGSSPLSGPVGPVAGQQLVALLPPLGLFVDRLLGEAAQRPDDRSVHAAGRGGDPRAGWLVHERHELVREAGHRAGDADAAHVRAAADAVDPAALGHVAPHDLAPAADLD